MASPFETSAEHPKSTDNNQKVDWTNHEPGHRSCNCGHSSPGGKGVHIAQNGLPDGVSQTTFLPVTKPEAGPDNYLLVIDDSPSMRESLVPGGSTAFSEVCDNTSKFYAGKASIQAFLRSLKAGDNVAVVMFGSTSLNPNNKDFINNPQVVKPDTSDPYGLRSTLLPDARHVNPDACKQAAVVSPLLPMGPGLREKIMGSVKAFYPSEYGATPLAYALLVGHNYLYANAHGPKHVVVMTDGQWTPDCGNPCETALKPWHKSDPTCEFTFIIVDSDPRSKIADTYGCVKQRDIGAKVVPVHDEEGLTGTMRAVVRHEPLPVQGSDSASGYTVTTKTSAQLLHPKASKQSSGNTSRGPK